MRKIDTCFEVRQCMCEVTNCVSSHFDVISWAANNRGSLDIVLPNLTCAKRTLSLEQLIIRSLLPVAHKFFVVGHEVRTF